MLKAQKILVTVAILVALLFPLAALSVDTTSEVCSRASVGSVLSSPQDLRSQNGALDVHLSLRNSLDAQGLMRYCYVTESGVQSPTLRVHPGDLLVLHLKNEISLPISRSASLLGNAHTHAMPGECSGGMMTGDSTNLHFHGLVIPPTCHQDDSLKTLIQPSDPAFEYRVRIPQDQPPGLYWYHPHAHGLSEAQVLGGASGALIVEGIEQANKLIAGLPERVIVIRDQRVTDPKPDPKKPGKDLSLNFVPVPYPDYTLAVIQMKPSERQFWRVLNASADTYVDLKLLYNNKPQFLGVIALDGVPLGYEDGRPRNRVLWESHIALPPAGRAEFVVNGPAEGVSAILATQAIVTGPMTGPNAPPAVTTAAPANASAAAGGDDDNSPPRPLATIVTSATAPDLPSTLPTSPVALPTPNLSPLASVKPVRERKLYFSEELLDSKDPNSPTIFYITEEGKAPKAFDPSSTTPDIVVHQGDVEDWTIENRSTESHNFHIHQTHFMVVESRGVPVDEPYLRDTINVPFWNGYSQQFPTVKLRMDFRDPNIVGTFPYHCHILQHEDGGMMGTIRVEPASPSIGKPVAVPVASK